MKAEPSRLIPQNPTENLEFLLTLDWRSYKLKSTILSPLLHLHHSVS